MVLFNPFTASKAGIMTGPDSTIKLPCATAVPIDTQNITDTTSHCVLRLIGEMTLANHDILLFRDESTVFVLDAFPLALAGKLLYATRHPRRPYYREAAPMAHGGSVSETHDSDHLLVRIFELLRMHQEALFKANLSIAAAVEAIKESDPQFAEA